MQIPYKICNPIEPTYYLHTHHTRTSPHFTLTDPRDRAVDSRFVTFAREHLLTVNVLRSFIQDQPNTTIKKDKYGTWQHITTYEKNPYRYIIAAYMIKDLTNLAGLTRSSEAQVLLAILKYGQTAQQVEETKKEQQGILSKLFNPQKKEEETP